MYYFLIRKIIYILLLLTGVVLLFFVGRSLFFSFENRTEIEKVTPVPKIQETVPVPLVEEKTQQAVEKGSEPSLEPTRPQPGGQSPPPTQKETPPSPSPIPLEKAAPERPSLKKDSPSLAKAGREKDGEVHGPHDRQGSKDAPRPENRGGTVNKEGKPLAENSWKVNKGDSIYAIAEKAYGLSNTSVVDRILEANPRLGDPDHLSAGQTLHLPKITEESLVEEAVDGLFQIRLGTFAKAEFAEYLKRHPLLKDKEVEVSPRTIPSGKTWYRVTAGKFSEREEALQMIRALKAQGLSPFFAGFKKKQ